MIWIKGVYRPCLIFLEKLFSFFIKYFYLMLLISIHRPCTFRVIVRAQISRLWLMMSDCNFVLAIIPFDCSITVTGSKLDIRLRVPSYSSVWKSTKSWSIPHKGQFPLINLINFYVSIWTPNSNKLLIWADIKAIHFRMNVSKKIDNFDFTPFRSMDLNFSWLIIFLPIMVLLLL